MVFCFQQANVQHPRRVVAQPYEYITYKGRPVKQLDNSIVINKQRRNIDDLIDTIGKIFK